MKQAIHLYTEANGNQIKVPVISYKKGIGPKVILTCLNHGNEIIGLEAALQTLGFLKNDRKFQGEIIILTCMNYQGFIQNSRVFEAEAGNPTNPLNLNRAFGASGSNLTFRVARKILDWIVSERPDFVFDMHSYSSNSLLHTIVDRPGGELEHKLIEHCRLSQVPFYLEYELADYVAAKLDFSLSNQLCLHNIPVLTLELGTLGGFSYQQSLGAKKFVLNNLVLIFDLEYKITNLCQNLDFQNQLYNRFDVLNEFNICGYLRPLVEIGQFYIQNTVIAEIVNLEGIVVHTVKMPKTGILCLFNHHYYMYPGSNVALILVELT